MDGEVNETRGPGRAQMTISGRLKKAPAAEKERDAGDRDRDTQILGRPADDFRPDGRPELETPCVETNSEVQQLDDEKDEQGRPERVTQLVRPPWSRQSTPCKRDRPAAHSNRRTSRTDQFSL